MIKYLSLLFFFILGNSLCGQTQYKVANIYGKFGIVKNAYPDFSVKPQYDEITSFSINYYSNTSLPVFRVKLKNLYGISDAEGKLILPIEYQDINVLFSESQNSPAILSAKKDSIWILFSASGKKTGEIKASTLSISSDEKYILFENNGFSGIAARDGKSLTQEKYSQLNYFNPDFVAAKSSSGNYGIIKADGTVRLPFIYEDVLPANNNDGEGNITAIKGDTILQFDKNLKVLSFIVPEKPVKKNYKYEFFELAGKYGIKFNDKVIVTPQYKYLYDDYKDQNIICVSTENYSYLHSSSGKLLYSARKINVVRSNKFNYIIEDETGKNSWLTDNSGKIISEKYSKLFPVYQTNELPFTRAVNLRADTVYETGYLNEKGKTLIPLKKGDCELVFSSRNNKRAVLKVNGNEYLVDLKSGVIEKDAYENVLMSDFGSEIKTEIWKLYKKDKYALYNPETNKIIVQAEFQNIYTAGKNKLLLQKRDNVYGVINEEGKFLLDTVYSEISWSEKHNAFFLKNSKGQAGIADADMKFIFPMEDQMILQYEDGLLCLNRTNGEQFLTRQLNKISFKEFLLLNARALCKAFYSYGTVKEFNYKYACVKFENRFGVSDTALKLCIDFKYDSLCILDPSRFSWEDYFIYKEKGLYGITRINGKISEAVYDSVYAERGAIMVKEKNKWGVLDSLGKIIVKPEYDMVLTLNATHFALVKEKKSFVLDLTTNKKTEISWPLYPNIQIEETRPFFQLFLPEEFDSKGERIRKKYFMEPYAVIGFNGTIISDSLNQSTMFYFTDNSNSETVKELFFFSKKEKNKYRLYNMDGSRYNDKYYDTIIRPSYSSNDRYNNVLLLIEKKPKSFSKKLSGYDSLFVFNFSGAENSSVTYVNAQHAEKKLNTTFSVSKPVNYYVNDEKGIGLEFINCWFAVTNKGGKLLPYFSSDTISEEVMMQDSMGNDNGSTIVYDNTNNFNVHFSGGKFGLISSEMKTIAEPVYDDIALFTTIGRVYYSAPVLQNLQTRQGILKNEYLPYHCPFFIKKDNKWGAINPEGETIIAAEFDSLSDLTNSVRQHFLIAHKNGKKFIYNLKGEKLFEQDFISQREVGYKMAVLINGKETVIGDSVCWEGKAGIRDNNENKWILEPVYDSIAVPFNLPIGDPTTDLYYAEPSYELQYVSLNNSTSYTIAQTYIAEDMPFIVKKDGKLGLIRPDGRATPFIYDRISFDKNTNLFEANDKEGKNYFDKNLLKQN